MLLSHTSPNALALCWVKILAETQPQQCRTTLSPASSQVLSQSESARPAIVICHTFPDCWLRPGETSYPKVPGSPCPTEEMKGK